MQNSLTITEEIASSFPDPGPGEKKTWKHSPRKSFQQVFPRHGLNTQERQPVEICRN